MTLVADLSTGEGVAAVVDVCGAQPLSMLVNNAGVAHYVPIAQLPASGVSFESPISVAPLAPLARNGANGQDAFCRRAGPAETTARDPDDQGPPTQPGRIPVAEVATKVATSRWSSTIVWR